MKGDVLSKLFDNKEPTVFRYSNTFWFGFGLDLANSSLHSSADDDGLLSSCAEEMRKQPMIQHLIQYRKESCEDCIPTYEPRNERRITEFQGITLAASDMLCYW